MSPESQPIKMKTTEDYPRSRIVELKHRSQMRTFFPGKRKGALFSSGLLLLQASTAWQAATSVSRKWRMYPMWGARQIAVSCRNSVISASYCDSRDAQLTLERCIYNHFVDREIFTVVVKRAIFKVRSGTGGIAGGILGLAYHVLWSTISEGDRI